MRESVSPPTVKQDLWGEFGILGTIEVNSGVNVVISKKTSLSLNVSGMLHVRDCFWLVNQSEAMLQLWTQTVCRVVTWDWPHKKICRVDGNELNLAVASHFMQLSSQPYLVLTVLCESTISDTEWKKRSTVCNHLVITSYWESSVYRGTNWVIRKHQWPSMIVTDIGYIGSVERWELKFSVKLNNLI